MKTEWKIQQLSDIAEFNPKETLKKGAFAKKISMDKLQPFCRDISEYELTKFTGGTKFRNGDTIMARITPCLENGKTAKINILDNEEIGFGSTEYIVLRAKDGISNPDFIYYLVTSSLIREPAIKSMVGSSGRQRVQSDVVEKIKINLPPLPVQKKIAGILKSLDDKIELNRQISKNLEEQAQAIFKDWFIDHPKSDWKIGKLSEIAEITMGQSPDGSSYNENKMGVVFYQGRAEFGFRFPTQRLFTTQPKRMAKRNDILLSVRAPVGDINVANENCCIGRGLAAIHSRDNHQSFLLYTMYSLKEKLDIYNAQGTVFGCINRDALNDLEIVIPPRDTIDKFEKIASSLDAKIAEKNAESTHLTQIRDTILPKLMSGEIEV